MIKADRKEVLRYLGFRGTAPTEEMTDMIEECVRQLSEAITPAAVYRRFPVVFHDDGTMDIADMHIRSSGLLRNLKGCTSVYMMACTIGTGCDRLIRRAEVTSMARAAVFQASGSAMVEDLCDQVNEEIRIAEEKEGNVLRPRFSPGYGDLSLELQKDFMRILDMPKTTGITLTDTLLMIPSKSVTAFIGVSACQGEMKTGCGICENRSDCIYSDKEGL